MKVSTSSTMWLSVSLIVEWNLNLDRRFSKHWTHQTFGHLYLWQRNRCQSYGTRHICAIVGIRKSKTKQSLNRYESRHTNKSLAKDTFHVLAGEKRKKFAESKKQLIYTHVPALFSYSLFVIRDIFTCICEILFSVIQREFQLTSFCLRLIR